MEQVWRFKKKNWVLMGEKKYSDKGKSGYEIGRAVKLQICRQARLLT